MRGIATLTVLLAHFLFAELFHKEWWWSVAHAGWLGVDLFFVLSGFLITGILLNKKGKPRYFSDFYRRRALRIFPLYYASLLLSVFAIVCIDGAVYRLWQGYDGLQWYLAFVPNIAIALKNDWLWQTNWVGLSHLWSLAVEEQFYIVWPFIVFVLPRRALVLVCLTFLFGGIFLREWTDAQFGTIWSKASYVLPYCRMDGLAAGSLLAILLQQNRLSFSLLQRSVVRDLTFAAGMVVFYQLIAANTHWRGTMVALMFMGFVYLALTNTSKIQAFCLHPFLRHIGQYSYALYIFHQMFRVIYERLFWHNFAAWGCPVWLTQVLHILCCFACTYGLARLSWRYLEKPFLDKKQ